MKLYFNPQSRAVIARWMLDECGVDYQIVLVDLLKGEHKTPEFLGINPAGKLPALVDGDARIFESAAICLYLGDKFPEANLAPRIGAPERGRYLSLMVYSTSQVEPAMGDAMFGMKPAPQRGWTDFETVKDVIERELGDGPYHLRRLVHRRRRDDRLDAHLAADGGSRVGARKARGVRGSVARASQIDQVRGVGLTRRGSSRSS
jgi:glutathione S-transferase